MKWTGGLFKAVGLVLFVVILIKVHPYEIFALFFKIKFLWFTLGVLGLLPLMALKSMRWQSLVNIQGIRFSFTESFRVYMATGYLGNVTPGRAGDFLRIFYLSRDGRASIGQMCANVLTDRLCDIAFLLSIGMVGLAVTSMSQRLFLVITGIMILECVSFFILAHPGISEPFLKWFFEKSILKKIKGPAREGFEDFFLGMRAFYNKKFVLPLILSLLAYGFFFASCFFLARALDIGIPFPYLVICITLVNIVSTLPLTVMGLGLREGLLVYLFQRIGLPQTEAVSFSLLFFLTFMVFGSIWGFWYWWKYPLQALKSMA